MRSTELRRPSPSDRSRRFDGGLLAWSLAGVGGAVLLFVSFPRVFPWLPPSWSVSRGEARTIALERLRDLGEPVADAYVVAAFDAAPLVERRLDLEARRLGAEPVRRSGLAARTFRWVVSVYPRDAPAVNWTYRAEIAMDGSVLGLRYRMRPEEAAPSLDEASARRRADEFLREQGTDLAAYVEPDVRTTQQRNRTDTVLRYRRAEQLLGERFPYGLEVTFLGDRLAGYQPFFEDPDADALREELRSSFFLGLARILVVLVFVVIVAVPFLRRYHAGEVGVRRGLEILAVLTVLGTLLIALAARAATEGMSFGILTRAQTTWAWGLQLVLFYIVPVGLLGLLAWSVGESLCRERWGEKLAAFDAVWQGRWSNSTVARSALRGTAAGLALVGATTAAAVGMRRFGAWAPFELNFGPFWPGAAWMTLGLLASAITFCVVGELVGRLFLVPWLDRLIGRKAGIAVAVLVSTVFLWTNPLSVQPIAASLGIALVVSIFMVWLFLRYDLLTVVLCSLSSSVVIAAMPLVTAADPNLQTQGVLAWLVAGLPMLVSLRHLGSAKTFEYRYDDVPAHVRRIAERERQRVELETARQIQSSILPDLPPQLNGVEIAHLYLPATEVGGDFYDVLALEDGRLALAVGDVAGHGVSSGLVMSMARSALAVQTTFDPGVVAVFRTLNRVVFQSARKRLLATLCYAVLDPHRRELQYASAGHLFPYRVTPEGRVDSLESVSYPLGVRNELDIAPRAARLGSGDLLVLFSDGLVEGRREGSDEVYGFDRLEEALGRQAGKSPAQVRTALLDEVRRFTRDAPLEDDLTMLILRLPAA